MPSSEIAIRQGPEPALPGNPVAAPSGEQPPKLSSQFPDARKKLVGLSAILLTTELGIIDIGKLKEFQGLESVGAVGLGAISGILFVLILYYQFRFYTECRYSSGAAAKSDILVTFLISIAALCVYLLQRLAGFRVDDATRGSGLDGVIAGFILSAIIYKHFIIYDDLKQSYHIRFTIRNKVLSATLMFVLAAVVISASLSGSQWWTFCIGMVLGGLVFTTLSPKTGIGAMLRRFLQN